MDEFSIETRSQNIFHSKTKEYFEEVVSSYQVGNYRSAVVMLWSVVVCDLLFKLQNLVDMYGDETARGILKEVSELQEKNEKSSTWEHRLIDLVRQRTNFLDASEYENLDHLQLQRHLSAHPVVKDNKELYRPNRDTVRALIRNTLDGVLVKPPIYTKKIFDEFITDLSNSASLFIDDQILKTYLESKYFSKFSLEVEHSIFRSLWKLIFKNLDEKCEENRSINYRALKLICNRNKKNVIGWVQSEKDYYSNIAQNNEVLNFLVHFLARWSELYNLLTDDAKIKINYCIQNESIGRCFGWFTKPSLDAHYTDLLEWIQGNDNLSLHEKTFEKLLLISDTLEWESSVANLASAYYCASRSFDSADIRFEQDVKPFLRKYKRDNLVFLLEQIQSSHQVYHPSRKAATTEFRLIKERCDEVLGKDYDYQQFPKFINLLVGDEISTE